MNNNEIADKKAKVSRSTLRNSSEAFESVTENIGFDREIQKSAYIYL